MQGIQFINLEVVMDKFLFSALNKKIFLCETSN